MLWTDGHVTVVNQCESPLNILFKSSYLSCISLSPMTFHHMCCWHLSSHFTWNAHLFQNCSTEKKKKDKGFKALKIKLEWKCQSVKEIGIIESKKKFLSLIRYLVHGQDLHGFHPLSFLSIFPSPCIVNCHLQAKKRKTCSANLKRESFLSLTSHSASSSPVSSRFSAIHVQLLWRRELLRGRSHASTDSLATFPSPWRHRLWPSLAATVQRPWRIFEQRAVMWHGDLRGSEWSCGVRQRVNGQRGTARICTNNSCFASRENIRAAPNTASWSPEQGDLNIFNQT